MDLYKTILCRQWAKSGLCPYEHRCMFSHGQPIKYQYQPIKCVQPIKYQHQPQCPLPPPPLSLKKTYEETAKFSAKLQQNRIDKNDYDLYWNIINSMLMFENQQLHC